MFQPDNHHLQSVHSHLSHSGSDSLQQKRRLQVLSNPATAVNSLQSAIPENISPNKKAVINRLIALYAQGALH